MTRANSQKAHLNADSEREVSKPENALDSGSRGPAPAAITPLLSSFRRHLAAERKDPDTIAHYVGASRQFLEYAAANGLPEIEHVTREHVEMWLEELHGRYRPYTVRNRFIGLRMFLRWLVAEDEISRDPMARLKVPSVEESPKDVAAPELVLKALGLLTKARNWRDAAIVAVIYDTGMRTTELGDQLIEDVDLDRANNVFTVKRP